MNGTTRPVRVYTFRKYPGDKDWTKEVIYERATFHRFGEDYHELEGGIARFPVAVIELADGTVVMPPADRIQFLDIAPQQPEAAPAATPLH